MFPGSPLRMQIGAELRGFHTCRVKGLGRSSSFCVPGCSMPAGEAAAFPLPFSSLCLASWFTPRIQSNHSPPRGSRDIKIKDMSFPWVAVKERAGELSFPSWAGSTSMGLSHQGEVQGLVTHWCCFTVTSISRTPQHSPTAPHCCSDTAFCWEHWHQWVKKGCCRQDKT